MGQFCTASCVRCLFAVVLLLAIGAAPAGAQSERAIYTVSDIAVDATADDAVSARRQALLEGQREGLTRLLRRLVPADEHGRLASPKALPVEEFVQNFEISDEEVSGTSYAAELTVAYDPEAVRGLLQSEELPFAETPSAPLLVLPVYSGPEGTRLWPEDNPWWQAWAENLDDERLLRLTLPLGDLQDMTQVSVADAEAGEEEALLGLAERYGSEDVLVVTASVIREGTAGEQDQAASGTDARTGEAPVIRLEAQRIGRVERVGEPLTLEGEPGQSLDDLLAEAVVRLQASLDERWKSNNLLRFDQTGLMVVEIPIDALSDWVDISRGLEELPEVSGVDVAAFSRRKVQVEIRYIGDQFRLEEALLARGLTLSREGETWQLRPTGESPAQGEPPSAT